MIPEPEAQERAVKEIAELWADRLEDSLMSALDEGWLIFKKGKPRERLAGYMSNTLAADMPLVLNPDYAQAYRDGIAPPLLAMQMDEARKAAVAEAERIVAEAQMVGVPVETPQLPPEPPQLWVLIMTLPVYVFEKLSRDFSHLLKAQAEREA